MSGGDDTIRGLQEALRLSPDNFLLRKLLADTLLGLGRLPEAGTMTIPVAVACGAMAIPIAATCAADRGKGRRVLGIYTAVLGLLAIAGTALTLARSAAAVFPFGLFFLGMVIFMWVANAYKIRS